MKEYLQVIREHVGEEYIRFMLIHQHLREVLEAEQLDLTLDLNPHLQVQHAVDAVITRVVADGEGITCTREDVYLFWLTQELGSNRVSGVGQGEMLMHKLNAMRDDITMMPILETEDQINAASRDELANSLRNALKKLRYLDEIAGMLHEQRKIDV